MKNKNVLIFTIGLIVIFAIILSSFSLRKKKLSGDKLDFQVNRSGRCETEKIYDMGEYDIYTYCVDEIFISDGKTKMPLKDYIVNEQDKAIDNIIKNLKHEWAIYDGGTEKFSNDEISLIKCRKLNKKEDVYIGIASMELEEKYCQN